MTTDSALQIHARDKLTFIEPKTLSAGAGSRPSASNSFALIERLGKAVSFEIPAFELRPARIMKMICLLFMMRFGVASVELAKAGCPGIGFGSWVPTPDIVVFQNEPFVRAWLCRGDRTNITQSVDHFTVHGRVDESGATGPIIVFDPLLVYDLGSEIAIPPTGGPSQFFRATRQ